jgi:hypothetical protein
MPLRDNVGRVATTGRQCQNWKKDQEVVIDLLNKIPIADGGAEGILKPDIVVTGHASDGLFSSILYFQQKNFHEKPDGFISPAGRTLRKLEELGAKSATQPLPKAGQWDRVSTPSVNDALRKALLDDQRLDRDDVIDIIRATLADGFVTAFEISDLKFITANSRSLQPGLRQLLTTFTDSLEDEAAWPSGPFRLTTDKQKLAADMVCDFLKNARTTAFPKLNRDRFGIGLLMRIANPGFMSQRNASLCGPAAMLFSYASDFPGQYARFALDLYQKGRANLGRLLVKPDAAVRHYAPDTVADVDWVTMASLRDSENWVFDFDGEGSLKNDIAGINLPSELEQWMRKAGYRDTREETNLYFDKRSTLGGDVTDRAYIAQVNKVFAEGYKVLFLLNGTLLLTTEQDSSGSVLDRHWIVQRSPIEILNGNVSFHAFSWGNGDYKIPEGGNPISLGHFLDNFFGYVAGKP